MSINCISSIFRNKKTNIMHMSIRIRLLLKMLRVENKHHEYRIYL